MRKEKLFYLHILIGTLVFLFCLNHDAFSEGKYRIGVDDVLAVSVWENPNLNIRVVVRPDGMISFPLLDDVSTQGKTPLELKTLLTTKLSKFINDPIVTVIVHSINSLKVYIQGEVVNPGTYPLREKITLAEIIATTGGIKSDSADFIKAFVLRDGKKLDVDFQRLFREGDISQNILLKAGDTIFIPDNFSSRLTVLGAVERPRTITYRLGMTVLDAILAVGGFTQRADPENTIVIRKVDGVDEMVVIDMQDVIKKGKMEQNIALAPADKIIVEEKWY